MNEDKVVDLLSSLMIIVIVYGTLIGMELDYIRRAVESLRSTPREKEK